MIERKPGVHSVRSVAELSNILVERIVKRHSVLIIAAMFGLAAVSAQAAPLPETMARLMAVMPGTYDTIDQVAAEAAQGTPEANCHERRHVIYARIDTPQIGPDVLFWQGRKGGPNGEIIARGLAVFAPDTEANGIRMWLRNMPNAERFTDLHLKKELWGEVSFDSTYGGKCPFHWRLEADTLVGTLLGGGCQITSNAGKAMPFDARWVVTSQSLSIFDNTYGAKGQLMSGRADKRPMSIQDSRVKI